MRRYVLTETAISMAINALLSVAFALLVFGGRSLIDVSANDVLFDTIPQSFMVALMGTLVPSLLTRKRLAAGRIAGPEGRAHVALNPFHRAILTAIVAAIAGTALLALLRPEISLTLPMFVAAKAIYGAVLAAIVTPVALNAVLRSQA